MFIDWICLFVLLIGVSVAVFFVSNIVSRNIYMNSLNYFLDEIKEIKKEVIK